ncbi:FkbM family methyltransferase [Confluentibacter lentus]|uniref:FkbM family methyltransferase n=1 Tax=Confluentibacter lentus TaxID=1699412 RepID=UPI000C28C92C|nr:FkbM family methyltransferase [Confluentibacter lentus]
MIEKIKRFIRRRYNISFSKSGDDIQLMKLINNNTPGTYVDIGCWHPIKASNTYFFHLRKWKGLCIDSNPELKSLYAKYRPSDNFINVGLGNSDSILKYYMFKESSMNTFSREFIDKHKLHLKIKNIKDIPIYSLKDILDKNLDENDRLDFFDVDVEGFDLEVLKTNDWDKYRPKVVVVESDVAIKQDVNSELVKYLESKNYRLIGKSNINGDLGNLFFISN